jgi:hypothetical protein
MIGDSIVVSANSTPMGWPMREKNGNCFPIKWTDCTLVLDGYPLP